MEHDIYLLHDSIIELSKTKVPDDIQEGYLFCNDSASLFRWKAEYLSAILFLVDKVLVDAYSSTYRANCPLCGKGLQQQDIGFKLPMGMTDHLAGNKGRAQCPIVKSTFALANDRLRLRHIGQ